MTTPTPDQREKALKALQYIQDRFDGFDQEKIRPYFDDIRAALQPLPREADDARKALEEFDRFCRFIDCLNMGGFVENDFMHKVHQRQIRAVLVSAIEALAQPAPVSENMKKEYNMGDWMECVVHLRNNVNSCYAGVFEDILSHALTQIEKPAPVSDDTPMEFSKAEKITLDQLEEHLKKGDDEDIIEITNDGAVRRRSTTKPAPVEDGALREAVEWAVDRRDDARRLSQEVTLPELVSGLRETADFYNTLIAAATRGAK